MTRERHPEVDRSLPERVVVVRAVDAVRIDEPDAMAYFGRGVGELWHRASDVAGDASHLQADPTDVLELGDGFVGSMHGNQPGHGHAIGERTVLLGCPLVEPMAQPATRR